MSRNPAIDVKRSVEAAVTVESRQCEVSTRVDIKHGSGDDNLPIRLQGQRVRGTKVGAERRYYPAPVAERHIESAVRVVTRHSKVSAVCSSHHDLAITLYDDRAGRVLSAAQK